MGGRFLSGGRVMKFTKLPLSYQEQIELLVSRGMSIDNYGRARRFLTHLNYYRLAAYWLTFEQDHATHTFKPGTTFDMVAEHYIFDRELRLLVMDAIERLEVSIRSQWSYHLAHTYGSHAHLDKNIFKPDCKQWNHADNVKVLQSSVRESSETFIKHLRSTYDEALPPIWAVCEIMTFGQLSRWYYNLKHRSDRNAIASSYDMDESNLVSFVQHLCVVRNFCAHHSSLWNRELSITWKLPNYRPSSLLPNINRVDTRHVYNTLVTLAYMMDILNPGHHWKNRLGELFRTHPIIKKQMMGFPANWCKLPIWRGNV